MEMWLFEKIPPSWQEEGNLQQQLQRVREPGVLRPERSHQGQLQPPRPEPSPRHEEGGRRVGRRKPGGHPMTAAWHRSPPPAGRTSGRSTPAGNGSGRSRKGR